uniref:Uncharacterized protein n=1 Tax=Aplanochytrium stocchinoi TaxID=215587 RepID=A0A7S3LQJ1_9STRA|mmetsp:Transcript_23025/g.28258  ORF Transcript_23025/g.28258 Transcript_23025/m.28258 type:complete len:634 (+) Transcript_23025:17-1918(+)
MVRLKEGWSSPSGSPSHNLKDSQVLQNKIDQLTKQLEELEGKQNLNKSRKGKSKSPTQVQGMQRKRKKKRDHEYHTHTVGGQHKRENGKTDSGWFLKYYLLRALYFCVFCLLLSGTVIHLVELANPKVITKYVRDWELAKEAKDVTTLTVTAMEKWSLLLFSLGQRTVKVLQPGAQSFASWFLSVRLITKVYIGIGLITIFMIWLLQREIKRRKYVQRAYDKIRRLSNRFTDFYNGIIDEIRYESRILAEMVPHLVFAAVTVALLVFAPALVDETSKGVEGRLMMYGVPMVLSSRALFKYERKELMAIAQQNQDVPETSSKAAKGKDNSFFSKIYTSLIGDKESSGVYKYTQDPAVLLQSYENLGPVLYWLRYWSVLAAILVIEPLFSMVNTEYTPFRILKLWPHVRLLFMLWLQMPGTNGAYLAFKWIIPLVHRYFRAVNVSDIDVKQSGLFVTLLSSLLGPLNGAKVQEIVGTSGGAILAAMPFLFIPFTTSLGCTVFGLLRPIHAGIVTILAVENLAETARIIQDGNNNSNESININSRQQNTLNLAGTSMMCVHWLEYWLIYPSITSLMDSIPFLPLTIQLLVILALQIPYFHGIIRNKIFLLAENLPLPEMDILKSKSSEKIRAEKSR